MVGHKPRVDNSRRDTFRVVVLTVEVLFTFLYVSYDSLDFTEQEKNELPSSATKDIERWFSGMSMSGQDVVRDPYVSTL